MVYGYRRECRQKDSCFHVFLLVFFEMLFSHILVILNLNFLCGVQESSKSTDLQTALQLSMRDIQHENVDVRIHALTSLKETLYRNQV